MQLDSLGNVIKPVDDAVSLPPVFIPLSVRDFSDSVLAYETSLKVDSQFIYRTSFSRGKKNQLRTRFTNSSGKQYTFKLLSRRQDTVASIDLIPQIIYEDKTLAITRLSDLYLKKEGAYYTTSFDYKLSQDCKLVDIVLNANQQNGKVANDFVLFVFKKEE